jgi:two-component system OmpR family sensor kinase
MVLSFAYIYYDYKKNELQKTQIESMKYEANKILKDITYLHQNFKKEMIYPRYKEFNSGIYDSDKNLIFSTMNVNVDFEKDFYIKDNFAYYIKHISPYYLGAYYIVIQKPYIGVLSTLGGTVAIVTILVILLVVITSFFLAKIVIKPIKDNLNLLDKFIKDTTHELNTPVSTILTNIELLEEKNFDEKTYKKINRIKIASFTISNIYDDLVYLVLNHKVSKDDKLMDINSVIKERVEYFDLLLKSKNLKVYINETDNSTLSIDDKRLIKVIDNLLSNSIKYTKKDKTITINIDKNSFEICDEGIGMTKEQISKVFDRYTRFDTTQGGFGIGYNIIYSIAKEYNIDIKITSTPKVGTCVKLSY